MRFWLNVAKYGNTILLRGVEDGKRFFRRVRWEPTLYERSETGQFRTMLGEPASLVSFSTIKEAQAALDERPGYYLGYDKWPYVFLAEEYQGRVDHDPSSVRIGYLDIETMADSGKIDAQAAEKEVTAITYKVGDSIFVFGCHPYASDDERIVYVLCSDEAELLTRFLSVWSSSAYSPDVVSGWNVEYFDVPYLVNRIERVLGEEARDLMSPWRIIKPRKSIGKGGREQNSYALVGTSILDYQRLFHKLGVMTRACDTPDDYKLNTVASQELGEEKIDYSEFESLHALYLDWTRGGRKYVDYNVHDVLLVEKLNDKLQLIELVLTMAYDSKVNFEDELGSVKPWECKIHHDLLSRGVVLPPRPKTPPGEELVGAYVKDPKPSGYDWVVSFDVDGMYPAIISMMNISPETKLGRVGADYEFDDEFPELIRRHFDELRAEKAVVAANSQKFRGDIKGYVPEILETVAAGRNRAKEKYNELSRIYEKTGDENVKNEMARWKNIDKGLKVKRNACYGVLTNRWFMFYDHDLAEAITATGQVVIKWVTRRINEFMNSTLGTVGVDYAIANDTDSAYVHMGPLVERVASSRSKDEIVDILDRICSTKMQEIITSAFEEFREATNAPVNYLSMKRETIADRGIWVGKKHYVLNMLDKEGTRYAKPKIEIKGMAAVKSSTPPACREKIKKAIELIMSDDRDAVRKFISSFREEFETLPFSAIAFPRGVSEISKWEDQTLIYRSGTPIQVRAAILYNRLVEDRGLGEYPRIEDGDKIKYAYLMTPNPITENVFGTPGPIPRELDVARYFDRDQMFEKGFVKPLETILSAIGWSDVASGSTLDEFF